MKELIAAYDREKSPEEHSKEAYQNYSGRSRDENAKIQVAVGSLGTSEMILGGDFGTRTILHVVGPDCSKEAQNK